MLGRSDDSGPNDSGFYIRHVHTGTLFPNCTQNYNYIIIRIIGENKK